MFWEISASQQIQNKREASFGFEFKNRFCSGGLNGHQNQFQNSNSENPPPFWDCSASQEQQTQNSNSCLFTNKIYNEPTSSPKLKPEDFRFLSAFPDIKSGFYQQKHRRKNGPVGQQSDRFSGRFPRKRPPDLAEICGWNSSLKPESESHSRLSFKAKSSTFKWCILATLILSCFAVQPADAKSKITISPIFIPDFFPSNLSVHF